MTDSTPPSPAAASPRPARPWYRRLIKWALLAVVAWYLAAFVIRNWTAMANLEIKASWHHLGFAFLFALGSYSWQIVLYRYFVVHQGAHLSLPRVWRIMSLSQLGKYVPGKVGSLVTHAYMLGQAGMSPAQAVASPVIFMISGILAGLIVGFALLPGSLGHYGLTVQLVTIALAVVSVVLFCSPLMWQVLNRLLRLVRMTPITTYPERSIMMRLLIGAGFRWCIYGCAYFELARFITPLPYSVAPLIVASIALSYFVGLVSLFAPAGLGVREGVLIAMLTSVTGPGFAAVFAAMSRLMMVAVDIVMVSVSMLLPLPDPTVPDPSVAPAKDD